MDDKYKNARFIFVAGIGGSDLAAKAVWNAMTLHKTEVDKKIFFLEAPDAREFDEIKNIIEKTESPGEFVLIAVSKSGETKETLETFGKVSGFIFEKFGSTASEQMIIISTPESILWKTASEKNIKCAPWQDGIGGRFSAFTVAHTMVLKIAGLDADAFVNGGKEMEDACKNDSDNPAKKLADKIFSGYKQGEMILDFFIFNSELEDLGKWCRQLIAESLGKKNEKGEEVGIMPIVSIGPADLHSMLQLSLGGPKNKFTLFIKSSKEIAGSINETAYANTLEAYKNAGLPFENYEIEQINEKEIGKFMSLMMQTTLKLGELLRVNVFDQPEVENYKKILKQ